jgi:hypothetical protein
LCGGGIIRHRRERNSDHRRTQLSERPHHLPPPFSVPA